MVELAWPVALFLSVCVVTGSSVFLRLQDKPQDPSEELRAELREIKSKVNALSIKKGLSI